MLHRYNIQLTVLTGPSTLASDLPPAKMDVTIAVQHLVNNSEIIFHNDVAKSGLMGFCDLAPGQDKSLVIYYVWKGRPYKAKGMVFEMDHRRGPFWCFNAYKCHQC